jgi:ABC-2 type transport system ATP-binding protein
MDPQNRSNLWDHILRLREEQGTTIVLTTHYLEEADVRAERVLVIDHGRIIADDTAANLKATLAGDEVSVTVAADEVAGAVPVLSARGREVSVGTDALGATVSARFENGPQALPWVLQELAGLRVTARAAEVRRPTLDDVFLSLTGRSLRDEGAVESARDEGAVESARDEGAVESARDEGAVNDEEGAVTPTDLVHEDEGARA